MIKDNTVDVFNVWDLFREEYIGYPLASVVM